MLTSLQKPFENGMIASPCFNCVDPQTHLNCVFVRFEICRCADVINCFLRRVAAAGSLRHTCHVTRDVTRVAANSWNFTKTHTNNASTRPITLHDACDVTTKESSWRHGDRSISTNLVFVGVRVVLLKPRYLMYCLLNRNYANMCNRGRKKTTFSELTRITNIEWKPCFEACPYNTCIFNRVFYSIQEPRSSWAPLIQHCT